MTVIEFHVPVYWLVPGDIARPEGRREWRTVTESDLAETGPSSEWTLAWPGELLDWEQIKERFETRIAPFTVTVHLGHPSTSAV